MRQENHTDRLNEFPESARYFKALRDVATVRIRLQNELLDNASLSLFPTLCLTEKKN